MVKEDTFYKILLYLMVTVIVLFSIRRYLIRYDEPIREELKSGIDTKGTIYRYERFSGRNPSRNIFYYFRANNFLFYGSTSGNIENCENDSSCIGKVYRVRYLPSDPNVHQIFFFDKINGINWTDTIPEKR